MTELTTIDFHGAKLVAIGGDSPESVRVAMKPIVEGMGLDWGGQHKKIEGHPVLSKGISVTEMPSAGGPQQVMCLPLNRIHFWLATIHPDRIKDPAVRERVILYQTEAADVLFNHFFGKVIEHPADELAERTNGITRMLAKKVTAQGKALERLLEILEANSLPARVEVPSGATLVRQHARRVSTDRDTGLRMKALVERLEKFFPPDAPPLMPMPDMHQHMVYRLYGHFLLVDTGTYNLRPGEKALVIDAHGRLTLAVMAVNGNQEGSLWSGDRRGWAYMTKAGGAPGECEIGLAIVVGRHLQTMSPEYQSVA